MPQHEVGYRAWTGKHTSQASRWWIIAETGFQAALKSSWVRRILFVAWLPIFYWGTIFFVLENVIQPPEFAKALTEQLDEKLDNLTPPTAVRNRDTDIPNDDVDKKLNGYKTRLDEILAGLSKNRDNLPDHQRAREVTEIEGKTMKLYRDVKNEFRPFDANDPRVKEIQELSAGLQQTVVQRARIRATARRFGWVPGSEKFIEALKSDSPEEQRHIAWSLLLMTFFRYPQATMIIFLLGIISPGLISRDIRSRAYLIYFSKPIGRREYITGKLAIPAVFLLLVTTLPALCLYILGVSLSPDLSVILSTWDIPIRIILASVVLIIPTACLSLMLSSLTAESRFATFAWFAVWILGHGAWMAIWMMQGIRTGTDPIQALSDPVVSGWSCLSLYNNLGNVQSWIFGLNDLGAAMPGMIVLSLLTIVSIYILFRRVSAPIRV
ncbi:ABC transporter permease [bacterium]|nr:ABC transporter permease [bacterium]